MKLAPDTDTNPRLSAAISNYSVRHLVRSYGDLQPTANGHRTDNSHANLTLSAHHQPTYLSQATLQIRHVNTYNALVSINRRVLVCVVVVLRRSSHYLVVPYISNIVEHLRTFSIKVLWNNLIKPSITAYYTGPVW